MDIDWNKFAVVAFIDSNVALECLALEQLPWREVDKSGPILVLVVPTVLQEVDSKKNHARLGDHARRFNRTLRALVGARATVVIRESPVPQIEVAFAHCRRIDWSQYPDLDPDEPDSRVVAQTLTASGPPQERRVVMSQDIRPLHLAQQHGLRTYHIGENWLRPKEESEAEKRAKSLKREIDAMKNRQPNLNLSFKTNTEAVTAWLVKDLSLQDRTVIRDLIVRNQPMPRQSTLNMFPDYDHSLEERYKRWEAEVIPRFLCEYERKLEINFGQVEIRFRVANVGQVPAESLLIHLSASGGWLNDRYVLASPLGPGAPRARSMASRMWMDRVLPSVVPRGKHEFVVLHAPKRSKDVQISCADFRHGFEYEYRVIGWIDPRADEFRVEAVVTAGNLYGEAKETLIVGKTVSETSVFDLVDPATLKFRQAPEIVELLNVAVRRKDFSDIEFDGADRDDE